MRARRLLLPTAGLTALAFGTLVIASPAAAAVLPEGQRIDVVQNLLTEESETTQVWTVNPATAAGTAVGGASTSYPITGIDVDDDGHGYALSRADQTEDGRPATIAAFDANTGTYGPWIPLGLGEFTAISVCTGIDYQPGEYPIVACKWRTEEGFGTFLVRIDPATGQYVGDDALYFANNAFEIDSIARVAGSDVLVVFYTLFGDTGIEHGVAGFDLTTNEFLDEGTLLSEEVRGADADRNGQIFVSLLTESDTFGIVESLATVDVDSGDFTYVGEYPFDVDVPGSNVSSLTVWGKPALAATGTDSAEVVPIALGTALLLLAGAAFVATARLGRRTS